MKRILLLLTLGASLALPALAQSAGSSATTAATPPVHNGPPPGGHRGGPLTPEERQELMAARKAALEANPDLAAEQKALQEKINAAMIKADPNVAPLIAKLAAGRQHHDGQGGSEGSAGPSGN